MRRAVLIRAAGAAIAAILAGTAPAQEPAPRPPGLGGVNNDPSGCNETPSVIRQFYAECVLAGRRAARPDRRGEAAPDRPAPQAQDAARPPSAWLPAPAGTGTASGRPMPSRAGGGAAEGEHPARGAPPATRDAASAIPGDTRCRSILMKGQLGEGLSDEDRAYLQHRCQ